MKRVKQIDFWMQALLMSSFLVISLVKLDNTFIIGYIVVGAWQVVSMIVHQAKGCYTGRSMPRYYYHWFTLLVLIAVVLGTFIPFVFINYYFLLFASPLLALGYLKICYHETFQYMVRPLELV